MKTTPRLLIERLSGGRKVWVGKVVLREQTHAEAVTKGGV